MTEVLIASYIVLWLLVIALSVMVVVLYYQLGEIYLGTAGGRARDGIAIGASVPKFRLPDLDGSEVSFPPAASAVLVFALPTCGPCMKLMPELGRFARAYPELEFLVIGGDDAAMNRGLQVEAGISVPVLTQPSFTATRAYKVRNTPFAFSIDGDGRVTRKGIVNSYGHLAALVGRDTESAPAIPMAVMPTEVNRG